MAGLGHPIIFQWVSRLGSVTARHFISGRQPNFAALNRGRHLYSAGRPSRWALALISSSVYYLASFYVRQKLSCSFVPLLAPDPGDASVEDASSVSHHAQGRAWMKVGQVGGTRCVRPSHRIAISEEFVYVTTCINNNRQRRLHTVSLRPVPGSSVPLLSASPTKY